MSEGEEGGCRPVEGNGPDEASHCHKLYGYKTNGPGGLKSQNSMIYSMMCLNLII